MKDAELDNEDVQPQSGLSVGQAARPIHPIDLRVRSVRVKRALTDGHGKSDLPCPHWLTPRPLRCRASGRKRVARHGRNGADAMARIGCRARTL
jgi:hypothetical protein